MSKVSPEVIELKPCPFCGKAPKIESIPGSYGYYPEKLVISCCNGISIGADVEEYNWEKRKHVDISVKARADIIKRWNTRFNFNQPIQG